MQSYAAFGETKAVVLGGLLAAAVGSHVLILAPSQLLHRPTSSSPQALK